MRGARYNRGIVNAPTPPTLDRAPGSDAQPGMHAPTTRGVLRLWMVLVLSLGLCLVGLDWGLPNQNDWSVDSVGAEQILATYNSRLVEGWISSYPPVHARLLAAVWAGVYPVVRVWAPPDRSYSYAMPDGRTEQSVDPARPMFLRSAAILMARAVSVLMGLGCLVWVYLIGRRLWDTRAGIWAALLVALLHPFVFYSHVSNREVPCLFWLLGAVHFYLVAWDSKRVGPWVALAVLSAVACGTKDQAAGALVLMGVSLWWHLARTRPGACWARWGRALADRRLWVAGLVFIVVLGACHGLPFQWTQFVAHVERMTGPDREAYRLFDMTPAGQWGMLVRTLRLTRDAMGWPLCLGVLAALALSAWHRRHRRALLLLVPVVSYYVFFLALVLYVWVRWTLPMAALVCVPAGYWASRVWMHRSTGWRVAQAGLLVALLYTAWYGGSASLYMAADGRYEAESWIERWAHQQRAQRPWVLTFSGPAYLPRWFGQDLYVVPVQTFEERFHSRGDAVRALLAPPPRQGDDPLALVRARPFVVVLTQQDMLDPLCGEMVAGRLGFRVVKRFKRTYPLAPDIIASLNPAIYILAAHPAPAHRTNAS